jgi:hypothetical protein
MQARESAAYPAASSPTGSVRASHLTHPHTPHSLPYSHCTSHQLPTSFLEKTTSDKQQQRTGAMNVMTPTLFIASILTIIWPYLRGTSALVTLALLYGASLGGFVALVCEPMIALGDSTDVGRRTGTYLTVLSLCSLAGPPISGAIYHATGGYSVVGIYAGRFFSFFFF